MSVIAFIVFTLYIKSNTASFFWVYIYIYSLSFWFTKHKQCSIPCIEIERNIVFRFTSKNHNSLFHPYRNHQVVSNFENVGCFYQPTKSNLHFRNYSPPDDSYTDETDCCGFMRQNEKLYIYIYICIC